MAAGGFSELFAMFEWSYDVVADLLDELLTAYRAMNEHLRLRPLTIDWVNEYSESIVSRCRVSIKERLTYQ